MGRYDDPIGSVLIATWICSMLEMVVIKDTIYYYTHFQADHILLKLFVGLVVIVDFVALVASYGQVYLAGVTFWGNPIVLEQQYWPIPVSLVAIAFTAFFVQSFLIHRVLVLTKNWFVCFPLAIGALLSVIGCTWVAVLYAQHRQYADRYLGKVQVIVWMTATTATDILITVSLIARLYSMKTTFKQTETIIHRLIRNSMQTGATTAFLAVFTLVAFLYNNSSNLEAATAFILSRAYVLTLLYNVNLRSINTPGGNSEKPDSNHRMGPVSHVGPAEAFGGIEVHRTAHVHMDGDYENDQEKVHAFNGTDTQSV
ncbi:hypothetical protein V5O48_018533 [Marasmius crinis-equi]|uniref:DUF6534 domain-containing protein n=1 Tax=Marasmius crinis-equi TaxID=585013 RepID=A0ABR3EKY3_9AGAR